MKIHDRNSKLEANSFTDDVLKQLSGTNMEVMPRLPSITVLEVDAKEFTKKDREVW